MMSVNDSCQRHCHGVDRARAQMPSQSARARWAARNQRVTREKASLNGRLLKRNSATPRHLARNPSKKKSKIRRRRRNPSFLREVCSSIDSPVPTSASARPRLNSLSSARDFHVRIHLARVYRAYRVYRICRKRIYRVYPVVVRAFIAFIACVSIAHVAGKNMGRYFESNR